MKEKIAIVGAGPGGMTMAVQLGLKGNEVNIYDMPRFDRNIKAIQEQGGIKATGKITGFYKPNVTTTNIKDAIKGVDIVFMTARAFGHQELMETIIPHLESGQIILNWTSYFSSLRFQYLLNAKGPENALLAEGHILPYFTKIVAPAATVVYGVKKYLKVGVMPSKETNRVMDIVKRLFPQAVAATNVLETSLDNQNLVSHVPPSLLNVGWWERTGGDLSLYGELITPKVAEVIEACDKERLDVGDALGLKLTPKLEMLNMTYSVKAESIYEGYRHMATHHKHRAKMSLDDFAAKKALGEDLLYGFVPLASLGDQVHVDTPTIDALTTLACAVFKKDYWKNGLTSEKLGVAGMSVSQIVDYVTQGKEMISS